MVYGQWHTFQVFRGDTATVARIDDGEWEVLGVLPREVPGSWRLEYRVRLVPQPEGDPEA